MSRWTRATGYSPIPGTEDQPVVIGPFESQADLDAFLDKHGRVFSSKVEVYSPEDYTEEAERLIAEDMLPADGKRSYGPL
jgi:hypothetical protein